MTHISVVIPVYLCEGCLPALYKRLCDTLEKISHHFEIIMVNDGSPDNSWEVITNLAEKDKRVVGLDLSRNFGQHCAITAGLDFASGDWVVVMDCDLQDQPEEILKLYRKAQEGYDCVFGGRTNRQDNYLKRLMSNLFYKLLSYLTETSQDASIGNFGIYNKKVINAIRTMREYLRYFPFMVKWIGFNAAYIEIVHANREIGKTSYSLKKLIHLAVNVMISFSDKPLRLVVKLGVSIASVSFVCAAYIFIRALLGIKGVEGWPSLIVSMWLLSGLIISILGMVGIYIGKTFEEVKKRPIYIVKETTNDQKT